MNSLPIRDLKISNVLARFRTLSGMLRSFHRTLLSGFAFGRTRVQLSNGATFEVRSRTELFHVLNLLSTLGPGQLQNLTATQGQLEFRTTCYDQRLVIRLPHYGDVNFTFVHDGYSELDVSSRLVLDIGAAIGDTALYFAARGAKRVLCYEPNPFLFKIATLNCDLNRASSVVLHDQAVGSPRTVLIDPAVRGAATYRVREVREGVPLIVLSLDAIVMEYGIVGAVMKMDCEGCEYEALSGASDSTLRAFDQIQLEYHHGPDQLVERLDRVGFAIKVIPDETDRHSVTETKVGQIVATLKSGANQKESGQDAP